MSKAELKKQRAKALKTMGMMIAGGTLLLHGIIGDQWDGLDSKTIAGHLAELDDELEQLVVSINSAGGYVHEGMAIYNMLNKLEIPVIVEIEGIAASMASIIAMVGDEIHQPQNAIMMIHNPWNCVCGDAPELRKQANVLEKLKVGMITAYQKQANIETEEISGMMDEETWLTAAEALEMGFITHISGEADDESLASINYLPLADKAAAMARDLTGQPSKAGTSATPSTPITKEALMPKPNGSAEPKTPANIADEPVALTPAPAAEPTPAPAAEPAPEGATNPDAIAIFGACEKAGLDITEAGEIMKAHTTLAAAQGAIIDKIADKAEASAPSQAGHVRVSLGQSGMDDFKAQAPLAIMAKANMKKLDTTVRNDAVGYRLIEMARICLEQSGVNTAGMGQMEMVGAAFTAKGSGGHSTSDFANILADVANKAMLIGYEETEETFTDWTQPGTLTDFKASKRVDLGFFPSLDKIAEGGEYKFGTMGERGETAILGTYGKMFAITRQAIINDDLGAFTRIPSKMGRAAIRTIGDLVYAVLTSNPVMSDGVALFDAAHSNLAAASVPTTTSFNAARVAFATHKDPENVTTALNISPAHFIGPVALHGTASVVVESETKIEASQNNSKVPNSVRGMVDVITDARLDANSATKWYMAAAAGSTDTIEVAYLDGQQAPTLEEQNGWSVDGIEMKVRLDAGVTALAFEGLYRNG